MSDTAREDLLALKKPELIAKADDLNVDSSGTKEEIVDRLLEREEKFAAAEEPAAEEPAAEEPAAEEPAAEEPAADEAEAEESTNPAGEYTIEEETNYHDFAKKVGFRRSGRELAALNGVRNGRLELHPGDVVTVP